MLCQHLRGDAVPTRLFWVICFLILVPFSHGQTTPVPRTWPSHKLTIRVRFVNAGLLWAGQQEQITKRLQEEADNDQDDGELTDLSDWADEAAERVRAAYQDNGYFKVQVAGELAPATKSRADRRVSIVVRVLDAGQQYKLHDLRWKNMTAFSEQQLLDLMPIHPGEIFSRSKIAKGLEEARKLYHSHGYMNFTSIPNTLIDEAGRGIALEIDVDEGGAFHWGNLHVEGMREPDKLELLRGWEGLRGQVYASEPNQELDKFFATYFRPLRSGVTPSDYAKWKIDEKARTVDVYLSLMPNPSLLKYIPKSWRNSQASDKSNR
jgi:hypothetical protein